MQTSIQTFTPSKWRLFAFVLIIVFSSPAFGDSDKETLERLERIVQRQQTQIEALQKQVEALTRQSQKASEAAAAIVRAETSEESETRVPTVTNKSDKMRLEIYGQVNRAMLYTNDGNEDNFYHVDNDNSSTRVGFEAKAGAPGDITVGAKLEAEMQSNDSDKVNQEDKNGVGDRFFRKRHLDLFFNSNRFGKLSVGYGSVASDGSSEVDLSGTSVVGYSGVSGFAGGHYFYDKKTHALSTVKINHIFNNMDGMGRDDRIRYDTPSFYGISGSVSNVSGGSNDAALRCAAEVWRVKLAAALAYADFDDSKSEIINNQVSGSFSLLHESGFNVTFAAANRDFSDPGRVDAHFYYGKFGYQHDFFPIGKTALALERGRWRDSVIKHDEADVFGALMVQDIAEWGTEYFLGFRKHTLDRTDADFEDIDAVMTGFRVKF